MKYDIYRVLDIDLTAKEYEAVRQFCQIIDDYMDYVDDYQEICEFIKDISRNRDLDHDKKINIIEEN